MALSVGKITVIVGAGLVCSVIAKQVLSSHLFSGSFKEVVNQLKRNAPVHSSSNSNKVANILSRELHFPKLTLVFNDARSEFGKYVLVVVVLGIGSGYVWWKGCRFSDIKLSRKRAIKGVRVSIPKLLNNGCFTVNCMQYTQEESELQLKENFESNVQHIDSALRDQVSEQRCDVSSSSTGIQQDIEKLESLDSELQNKNAMDSNAQIIVSDVQYLASQEVGISITERKQARSSQSDEMPIITYTRRNKKGAGTVVDQQKHSTT